MTYGSNTPNRGPSGNGNELNQAIRNAREAFDQYADARDDMDQFEDRVDGLKEDLERDRRALQLRQLTGETRALSTVDGRQLTADEIDKQLTVKQRILEDRASELIEKTRTAEQAFKDAVRRLAHVALEKHGVTGSTRRYVEDLYEAATGRKWSDIGLIEDETDDDDMPDHEDVIL